MRIIDTHCHIHDPEFTEKYSNDVDTILSEARDVGVDTYICVGTSAGSSEMAVAFAANHKGAYASLAIHPHEVAEKSADTINEEFARLEHVLREGSDKIVAIGECGLDYYYHSDAAIRDAQKTLFRRHLDLALRYDLPLIFHIRDAFDDFFAILDEYGKNGKKIRGVVHSFSAHMMQLEGSVARGLYIGLNGIMTFTRDERQLEAARAVPIDKLLLETDAPFLTPKPFRGTMCELKHVVVTAEFLSSLRGESTDILAAQTTTNAVSLFRL